MAFEQYKKSIQDDALAFEQQQEADLQAIKERSLDKAREYQKGVANTAKKIKSLGASSIPTSAETYKQVSEHLSTKQAGIEKRRERLNKRSKKDSKALLPSMTAEEMGDKVWERVKNGPLKRFGKDYIASQISQNGSKIIKKLSEKVLNVDKFKQKVLTPITEAYQSVFDAIAITAIAKNEVMMYFIRMTAQKAVIELNNKKNVNTQLLAKIKELQAALEVLIDGQPFFNEYVARLRKALAYVWEAERDLVVVMNTLEINNTFMDKRFEHSKELLVLARQMVEPPEEKNGSANIGINLKPEHLTIILSIPKLVQEALALAKGYFIINAKANGLLLAFTLAYDQIQEASSTMMSKFAYQKLKDLKVELSAIISSMSLRLNGVESSLTAKPGFTPDPIKCSTSALEWMLRINAAIEMYALVPTSGLKKMDRTNSAVKKYQDCVDRIKKLGDLRQGGAILTATEGREEIAQLERQLATYSLKVLAAIADQKYSSEIGDLTRVLELRLQLSITRDTEIISILTEFINAPLGITNDVKELGGSMQKMLRTLGMDRAADKLSSGAFGEFFGMNAKTATYAGAAIVGLQKIMQCTESSENKANLERAIRIIEGDQKKKALLLQRGVTSGVGVQMQNLDIEEKRLLTLQEQTNQAMNDLKKDSSCALPADVRDLMNPNKMFDNIFAVLGVNIGGSSTLSKELKSLSKGLSAPAKGINSIGKGFLL